MYAVAIIIFPFLFYIIIDTYLNLIDARTSRGDCQLTYFSNQIKCPAHVIEFSKLNFPIINSAIISARKLSFHHVGLVRQ